MDTSKLTDPNPASDPDPSLAAESTSNQVTQLLNELRAGDTGASARLYCLLYPEIKRLARSRLYAAGGVTSLNTTALVNEGFLRMADREGMAGESRVQFFAYVGKVLRSVVLDYLRAESAEKRGGDELLGCFVILDEHRDLRLRKFQAGKNASIPTHLWNLTGDTPNAVSEIVSEKTRFSVTAYCDSSTLPRVFAVLSARVSPSFCKSISRRVASSPMNRSTTRTQPVCCNISRTNGTGDSGRLGYFPFVA